MSTILKEKLVAVCYTAAREMATKPYELPKWRAMNETDKLSWVVWYDDLLKGHKTGHKKIRKGNIFTRNFLTIALAFDEIFSSYDYMKPQVENLAKPRDTGEITLFDLPRDKKRYEQALKRVSMVKKPVVETGQNR